jgi:catechol 2,3-dioxygenase-like lactoylglutathione lyase family enzyme
MVERPAGGAPPPRRPFDDVFPAVADAEDDDALAERITTYPSARPGPTGSIHGVGVTVLVTDLARSIAFYQDMLGFHAIDTGEGNAVLASGDTRLVLRRIHDVAPVNRRMVHLNLEVGNLQAVYDGLKARGVKFTYGPRPVNRGERLELWAAAFRDPDGHGIALTQWKGRPAERMGSAAADSGGSAEDAAPDVQHVRPDEGKHDPDRRQRPMQKPGEQ